MKEQRKIGIGQARQYCYSTLQLHSTDGWFVISHSCKKWKIAETLTWDGGMGEIGIYTARNFTIQL